MTGTELDTELKAALSPISTALDLYERIQSSHVSNPTKDHLTKLADRIIAEINYAPPAPAQPSPLNFPDLEEHLTLKEWIHLLGYSIPERDVLRTITLTLNRRLKESNVPLKTCSSGYAYSAHFADIISKTLTNYGILKLDEEVTPLQNQVLSANRFLQLLGYEIKSPKTRSNFSAELSRAYQNLYSKKPRSYGGSYVYEKSDRDLIISIAEKFNLKPNV